MWTIETSSKRYDKMKSLIGSKYDCLTVTGIRKKPRYSAVLCNCICGKEVETTVYDLKSGRRKSCGCKKITPYVRIPSERICSWCNVVFVGRGNAKYCSSICRSRSTAGYTGPIDKICGHCHKPFRSNWGKYCSEQCRTEVSYAKAYLRKSSRQIAKAQEKLCQRS